MYKQILILLIGIVLFTTACKDKAETEAEELKAYIEENNITSEPTESGLYYIETEAGTGNQAVAGKTVKVHYTGKFLDGELFDSSDGRDPIEFVLGTGRVIAGWDEGISYMKAGGKAKLIIPSNLAYGTSGTSSGSIPGYSTLIFDVELIEVGE